MKQVPSSSWFFLHIFDNVICRLNKIKMTIQQKRPLKSYLLAGFCASSIHNFTSINNANNTILSTTIYHVELNSLVNDGPESSSVDFHPDTLLDVKFKYDIDYELCFTLELKIKLTVHFPTFCLSFLVEAIL